MSASNLHIAWAKLFVGALASAGVTEVVLSPGSRSTPLLIAVSEEPRLRLHVIVDERSAAFFALGQARVSGRPSLLVCTSGTAGAHWLPAVIEASQSFVPMIALTADRPWELQGAAAPQTIDQRALFGGFVRHFADLGEPDAAPAALRAVPRLAAQAVARALSPTPGPVHVNARFRKPLDPQRVDAAEPWEAQVGALAERGGPTSYASQPLPAARAVVDIADRLGAAERGIIVCGPAPLAAAEGRDVILDLARRSGFAIFAEATSQIRFGGDRAGVVLLSNGEVMRSLRGREAPDVIVALGAPPTSAAYADMCAASPAAARFVIAPHGWNDPEGDATALIQADPAAFARAVAPRLPARIGPPRPWVAAIARADARAQAIVDRALAGPLSEGAVARALVASCPEGARIAVGNSTPVRDLDACCPSSARELRVLHQRGASGIDGLVSGAAGAASVAGAPVALLLGDLSLFHDLAALSLLGRASEALVVVVVQNGGGRIFEQLPIARAIAPDLLERGFVTPTPVRFDQAAAAFGVTYARADTREALDEALSRAWASGGATLIEAVVAPHGGAAMAARIKAEIGRDAGG